MIGKLYNYLTMLGSREKGIPCSEGGCITKEGKSSHRVSHVESEDVPKDISEPVISFLKCFEENPRRFKFWGRGEGSLYLKDKKEGILYERHKHLLGNKILTSKGDIYLTEEESELFNKVLTKYYQERSQRYKEILPKRKERDMILTRKRLTEVYKE